MNSEIRFVVPHADAKADPIHHIAIQAAAVMLQDWFKEAEPEVDEAKAMVETVMKALMGRAPVGM